MRKGVTAFAVAAWVAAGALPVSGQESEARNPDVLPPGAEAPDFALPGATRYGLLAEDVRLSEYRGQVVVLAFFFKARTRG